MPEVVTATPDENGNPRNWDDVFPIWSEEHDPKHIEGRVINQILYAIAENNRMWGVDIDTFKQNCLDNALRSVKEYLEDDGLDIEKRSKTLLIYGQTIFYIHEVFNNLGDVYREHKS